MTQIIKKIYVVISLLLVTSVGHAYGDYQNWGDYQNQEDYQNSEGYQNSGDYQDGRDYQNLGNFQNWSPYEENVYCCACPCPTPCCGKAFISADLLYWRAFESGLDACVPTETSDSVSGSGFVTSTFRGKGQDLHHRWDPGFRVGLGYESGCCGEWDVAVFWTHFHSHAHGHEELRWKINFDTIDVIAGYEADISNCFSIRPYFGVRFAKINQRLRSDDSFGILETHTHNKEKFRGVGPLLGLEAEWDFGCNFSFYTNAAISWLYGRYKINLEESRVSSDASDSCEVHKHLDESLAATDAGLGIRWKTCFFCNTRLILQLGLEHHRYYDFNRIGDCGDLSFDGANFSVGLEF